jgi:hypothetical protein
VGSPGINASFPLFPARNPEILDAQAMARMLGISTHAVYALFKKGELPGRKVARRWLTTRELVLDGSRVPQSKTP